MIHNVLQAHSTPDTVVSMDAQYTYHTQNWRKKENRQYREPLWVLIESMLMI